MSILDASVGSAAANKPDDVRFVQKLLNGHAVCQPHPALAADGVCGPLTVAAIRAFQQYLGFAEPDGRIDPGGRTLSALLYQDNPGKPLTLLQLCAIMDGLEPDRAAALLPAINLALNEFSIVTPIRIAAFLAQVGHETGQLRRFEENLKYSAKGLADTWPARYRDAHGSPDLTALRLQGKPEAIANNVYANRMGNGGESTGDGWFFHGRGPIQITGKDNYTLYGKRLNLPLLENPGLALEPEIGFRIAGSFWQYHGLNELADQGLTKTITKRINGGFNGLAEREALYRRCLKVLTA